MCVSLSIRMFVCMTHFLGVPLYIVSLSVRMYITSLNYPVSHSKFSLLVCMSNFPVLILSVLTSKKRRAQVKLKVEKPPHKIECSETA